MLDDEFGEIRISRNMRTTQIKIGVAPDGKLRATMPTFASTRVLRKLIDTSRTDIRTMLQRQTPSVTYTDGMQLGKSHSLIVHHGSAFSVCREQLKLVVTLPSSKTMQDADVQRTIRDEVIKILRREAKNYLPRRLSMLASRLNCHYERIRFSHASSRWGSCSSSGTISLNIALMKLPLDLIDYVIIHELCHTKQMNHSKAFWKLVEQADPDYRAHVKIMKTHTPTI